MTTTFQKEYARLNGAQKKAVDTIEGPVMVVAGPGTGKTQVLALRIANILKRTDTPPEAVLALTFTEKATANMRKRLVDLMGQEGWLVKVRTFHAFANEVIRSRPDVFEQLTGAVPLTDAERLGVIERILERLDLGRLRPLGKPELYVKEIAAAIDTLKREGIGTERFTELIDDESNMLGDNPTTTEVTRIERLHQLAALYAAYQEQLVKARRYDYADMLLHLRDALGSHGDLLRDLQERFLYLLVDEHQDTNGVQNEIVDRIVSFHDRPNLFVVGDLAQAIYRFQGASLANFKYFQDRYTGTKVVTLTHNYRSTAAVLGAAAGIMLSDSSLISRAGLRNEPVSLYAFSSPAVQEFALGVMIEERMQKGVAPEAIAVLARTNAELTAVAGVLERRGIAYQLGGDDQTLNDPDIRKVLAVARAVRDIGDDGPLLLALQVDLLGVDPLDSWALAQAARQNGPSAWQLLKSPARRRNVPLTDPDGVEEAAQKLTKLASDIRNLPAPHALERIVQTLGLIPYLAAKNDGERTLLRLHTLYELVRDQLTSDPSAKLGTFVDAVDLLERHGTALPATASVPAAAVQLLTVHKAKGLEFDTVFVPNAVASNWENKRGRSVLKLPEGVWRTVTDAEDAIGDDAAEEARRLVYVALTRAKRRAVFCWPTARQDGKPFEPSRFVLGIPARFRNEPDTSRFERIFAKQGHERLLPVRKKSRRLKDRVREITESRPFSVTALNNWLECPWKYFFVNLLRIPEAPSAPSEYGKAAHAALEHFFRQYHTGMPVQKSDLLRRFAERLKASPLNEKMRAQIEREGLRDLGGWYDARKDTFRRPLIAEESVTVSLEGGPNITGKLDKIEFLSGTPRGRATVEVVDYKTKAWMSENAIRGRTMSANGNEYRQLAFYKLLLNTYRGGDWQMSQGRIDFLKPKNDVYKSVVLTVSDRDAADLRKQIRTMMKEVVSLSFWDRSCNEPKCRYCQWRLLMSV